MQAEECGQARLGCNFFCRTCNAGGPKLFKASDEGFASMFEVCCLTISSVKSIVNHLAGLETANTERHLSEDH